MLQIKNCSLLTHRESTTNRSAFTQTLVWRYKYLDIYLYSIGSKISFLKAIKTHSNAMLDCTTNQWHTLRKLYVLTIIVLEEIQMLIALLFLTSCIFCLTSNIYHANLKNIFIMITYVIPFLCQSLTSSILKTTHWLIRQVSWNVIDNQLEILSTKYSRLV